MFLRANHCFAFASAIALASAAAIVESRGHAEDAQWILNLHPPTEDPSSVQSSLDVLMRSENEKRRRAADEFALEKQAMLDAEKRKIQDIIRLAFARFDSSF